MISELDVLARKSRFVAKYIRREAAPSGITSAQIDELMSAQGLQRLPEDYRTFLGSLGREAGAYAAILEVFPYGPEYKQYLANNLQVFGVEWPLEGSFVLGHQGGYVYWWLHNAAGDRPFVLRWTEGTPEPEPLARDFAGFVRMLVRDGDRLFQQQLEELLRRPIHIPADRPSGGNLERLWAAERLLPVRTDNPEPVTVQWEAPDRRSAPPSGPVPPIPSVSEWMAEGARQRAADARYWPPELSAADRDEAEQLWPAV